MTGIRLRHRIAPPYEPIAQPTTRPGISTHRPYSVGDAWHASKGDDGQWYMYADGPIFSRHRLTIATQHRGVTPVVVVLPDPNVLSGYPYCVHSPTMREGQWGSSGWQVTGTIHEDPPTLTVVPSINIGGGWHGFITNGYIL